MEKEPVLNLELELLPVLRPFSAARDGSSWPEPFCFEAPGCLEASSVELVAEVKPVPGPLVSLWLAFQLVSVLS